MGCLCGLEAFLYVEGRSEQKLVLVRPLSIQLNGVQSNPLSTKRADVLVKDQFRPYRLEVALVSPVLGHSINLLAKFKLEATTTYLLRGLTRSVCKVTTIRLLRSEDPHMAALLFMPLVDSRD